MIKNLNLLKCPKCGKSSFILSEKSLACKKCKKIYEVTNEQISFVKHSESLTDDSLNAVKSFFKKFPGFYMFLRRFFAPVYFTRDLSNFVKAHLGPGKCILHLGSGNSRFHKDIINIDLIGYSNVDLVADITKIPFISEAADAVILDSVLEHVPSPEKVLNETARILKPGGALFISVPFIMGFHAAPYDFYRWTEEGTKLLLKDYHIEIVKPEGGPTSALLWTFQEWVALVLSFGIKKLQIPWYILLLLTTWPIKYLDILFARYPNSGKIASAFIILCRKK